MSRERNTVDETVDEIAKDLAGLEMQVLTEGTTFADLVRIGAKHVDKANGWGDGVETACEISTAYLVLKAYESLDETEK